MSKGGWILLGVGAMVLAGVYYARKYATRQVEGVKSWLQEGGIPAGSTPMGVPERSLYQQEIAGDRMYASLLAAGIPQPAAQAQAKASNPEWLGPAQYR